MEISDLICIGKLGFSKNSNDKSKIIIQLKAKYQNFLPRLVNIFLIYKDHRVRYGKIDILQIINETKAIIDLEDQDLKEELAADYQAGVYLDELELNDLDDNGIYFDPVGMKVIWNDLEVGEIKDFFYNGAHDVYEIQMSDKRMILIPDVDSFVKETNIDERFINVVDLDQFLDI